MIFENINSLNIKLEEILKKQGKSLSDIILLAVTKTHSVEKIEAALESGILYIGENKVQEAEQKIPFLKKTYKEFHFIGHLQSNKINKLLKLKPALIHSIDNFSTAKKLNDQLSQSGKVQNILIQVNTSNEDSKFGIEPRYVTEFVQKIDELSFLRVQGLMTIGMFTTDEEKIRKCFRDLKNIFETIKTLKLKNAEMKYLSMGMSNDFEIALEEGANIIRVGSVIFGARK